VGGLLDRSLPEADLELVERIIRQHGLTHHSLRSRKSGSTRKIDLHLDVSPKATAEQIHKTCDEIEEEIKREIPGVEVLIHPEPTVALDDTRTVEQRVLQILEQHHELFSGFSDLHVHDTPDGLHISFRLRLEPDLTVAEVHGIYRHLTEHIEEQVADAKVFVLPEPKS
jgi:divalent metal cation (Fe/Co/Zn/Cd) transporter